MKLRLLGLFGLLGLSLLLGACGSGSSGGSKVGGISANCLGSPGASFCLVGCSLGCTESGCGISEIAVNQKLVFTFNRTVDPSSVDSTTFSLRTATGKRPAGNPQVVMDNGEPTNVVQFIPEVVVTGSQTAFGFDKGQTYLLHLPGKDESTRTLKSVNGFDLDTGLLCSLTASMGVVDPDGKPPVATLLVPTTKTNVPMDTLIEIGFSELLTMSTLKNPSAVDVYVSMKGGVPTLVQCDRFTSVSANPAASMPVTLTLKPSILLPSSSQVEVRVKGEIVDLAGKPCTPVAFNFDIKNTGSALVKLEENFSDTYFLDGPASGASWGNNKLVPGKIGGSGILGPFDKKMFVGIEPIANVLTISTDYIKVKASNTLTSQEILVNNGVFEFETFVVPAGLEIRFSGSNIPKIFSRGEMIINGKIYVNGLPASQHDGYGAVGGKGGLSNCGGGTGGRGASRNLPGNNGSAVAFPKGSPRRNSAAAIAAAGKGAPKFPVNAAAITYNGYDGWLNTQTPPGGSGGSNSTVGLKGYAILLGAGAAKRKTDQGPDNLPGTAFPYLPKLTTTSSALQFLAGGSGGGGGGSHALGSMKTAAIDWRSSQGGGSGGGALLLRAGGNLAISPTGLLMAAGGRSPDVGTYKRAAPGGGGSGGNILFQIGGTFLSQGTVSCPGGKGGFYTEDSSYTWKSQSFGGEGGFGYLRVEADPAPMATMLMGFTPGAKADNVGLLEDRDNVTGCRSKFYETKRLMPFFDHFLIEAVVNGVPKTYSDDSRLGEVPSFDPGTGTPVSLFLQGAQVDSQGEPILSTLTKWVTNCSGVNELKNWYGGKSSARPTSVRWILLFDKSVLTAPATIEIKSVTIYCQG